MDTELADLTGRVAIVTGAGAGQGAAHARLLSRLGARVVLTDVDESAVLAVADEIGESAIGLRHDVRSAGEWDAVVRRTDESHGRCDVLVNNAGVLLKQPLVETTEEDLRTTLEVNLMGPVLGMAAVVPLMSRHGGSIVNIASVAGLRAYPGGLSYSASKWGLRGASRSAARELGRLGIRVNCVCPGAIDTAMVSEDVRAGEGLVAGLPIPRIGRPDEVSALVAFLAGDASGYCTGQDFVIDGGLSA